MKRLLTIKIGRLERGACVMKDNAQKINIYVKIFGR